MSGEHTHVQDATFYRADGDDVVWVDQSGELPFPAACGGGGRVDRDEPALLIHLQVDGMFTIVEGQQVDRVMLEKAIEDLRYLVERLDRMHLPSESRGRCVEYGDWGRCSGPVEHPEGEHSFPTEQDWERSQPTRFRSTTSAQQR